MGKAVNFCLKIFNIVFCCAFIYILTIAVVNSYIFGKLNPVGVVISALIIFLIIITATYLLNNLSKKYLTIISVFNFIILILLQIFFANKFKVNPTWDFGVIFNEGIKFANDKNTELIYYYYGQYPNNIGVTFLMAIIFKVCNVFGIGNYLDVAMGFNIFVIDLAVLILYLFINKLYGYRISTIFSIFILLITPFYTYVPIVYTDTITMMFPILLFLLYYLYIKSKWKFKFIYLILGGIVIALGTILKTNVVIALIALSVYIILSSILFKKKFRCILGNLSMIIIPFIIVSTLYNGTVQKIIPIPKSEVGFPYTHWVMMGLRNNGGFAYKDPVFTASFPTKKERKEANIREIKKILNCYGVTGYIKFLNTKLMYTWTDGTFYAPEKLKREPIQWTSYHDYVLGDKRMGFLYLSQGSYIVMLLLIFIGAISMFKGKNKLNYLFNICILGVFLFLIMWETRSRYLVCFLPVFIISASGGLDYLTKIIHNK